MKYLVIFLSLLFFSSAKAQNTDAQCTGDPKKCSNGHANEEHGDEHAHEDEDHEKGEAKHDESEAHEDEHEHSENEKGEHAEHGKDEGHGEEHEESTQVGPDKGVLAANEKSGFKLSAEATKNFKLKFLVYNGGAISLSLDSILQTTEEKNVYRVRDGFIKRIDISVISKSKTELTFTSSDLKSGDQIVVSGLGFLRMAELAAFGGAPEGHSH